MASLFYFLPFILMPLVCGQWRGGGGWNAGLELGLGGGGFEAGFGGGGFGPDPSFFPTGDFAMMGSSGPPYMMGGGVPPVPPGMALGGGGLGTGGGLGAGGGLGTGGGLGGGGLGGGGGRGAMDMGQGNRNNLVGSNNGGSMPGMGPVMGNGPMGLGSGATPGPWNSGGSTTSMGPTTTIDPPSTKPGFRNRLEHAASRMNGRRPADAPLIKPAKKPWERLRAGAANEQQNQQQQNNGPEQQQQNQQQQNNGPEQQQQNQQQNNGQEQTTATLATLAVTAVDGGVNMLTTILKSTSPTVPIDFGNGGNAQNGNQEAGQSQGPKPSMRPMGQRRRLRPNQSVNMGLPNGQASQSLPKKKPVNGKGSNIGAGTNQQNASNGHEVANEPGGRRDQSQANQGQQGNSPSRVQGLGQDRNGVGQGQGMNGQGNGGQGNGGQEMTGRGMGGGGGMMRGQGMGERQEMGSGQSTGGGQAEGGHLMTDQNMQGGFRNREGQGNGGTGLMGGQMGGRGMGQQWSGQGGFQNQGQTSFSWFPQLMQKFDFMYQSIDKLVKQINRFIMAQ